MYSWFGYSIPCAPKTPRIDNADNPACARDQQCDLQGWLLAVIYRVGRQFRDSRRIIRDFAGIYFVDDTQRPVEQGIEGNRQRNQGSTQ